MIQAPEALFKGSPLTLHTQMLKNAYQWQTLQLIFAKRQWRSKKKVLMTLTSGWRTRCWPSWRRSRRWWRQWPGSRWTGLERVDFRKRAFRPFRFFETFCWYFSIILMSNLNLTNQAPPPARCTTYSGSFHWKENVCVINNTGQLFPE